VLLGAHVSWIFITAISAEDPLISLKYFIAKLWYIFPFFFLSQIFLEQKRDYVQWLNIFFAGFLISIFYVFSRHILLGLSFETIGSAVSPFYRNHVNYAALLIISLPLCWYMIKHSGRGGAYKFILILLILAIYFSYSRVALVSVVILFLANILLQKRLLFSATFVLGLLISTGIFYLIQNNNYLHYAPNYESTVAHEKFGNLLEATYQMEDISTMERVHRWVAGFNMIKERPWLGYGPNNFYFSYKAHTINSFQTYVSDNPDRSGIHNYFLMVAVEQGLVGFMIFVCVLLTLIYKAEQSFHSAKPKNQRDLIQMSVLVLVAIISLNLINDLLEAVKVGPFFFLAAGIIYQQTQKK